MRFSPSCCSCNHGGDDCCFDPAFEGDLLVEMIAGAVPGLTNEASGLNGLTSTLRFNGSFPAGRGWTSDDEFFLDYAPERRYYASFGFGGIFNGVMCGSNATFPPDGVLIVLGLWKPVDPPECGTSDTGCDLFAPFVTPWPFDGSLGSTSSVTVVSCDPVILTGTLVIPEVTPCTSGSKLCRPGYIFSLEVTITEA